jgi:hypothetical protein
MKTISVLFLIFASSLQATQIFRVDPAPVMSTAGNAPYGGSPALYAVSGATIALCTDAACSVPATTYTDATGLTSCPSYAPVVLPGTTVCTSTTGPQGQFGFWVVPGTYYYRVTVPNGQVFGNYPITSNTAGVTQTTAGTGIAVTNGGVGTVTISNTGVTQAAAGSGISVTNGGVGSVTVSNTGALSFNGRTGAITPQAGDYTAAQVTNAVDSTQAYNNPAWLTGVDWSKLQTLPPLVNSFAGRNGVLLPQAGDYNWADLGGAKQGTTTVPQMAGVNSGVVGAGLCNDATGNATTAGCTTPGLPAGSQTQYLQIQPNTTSLTYRWATAAHVPVTDYNFPAQSPGGALNNGIANAVSLAPCPLGVAGTDAAHYLYVSGGVGAAEAVLIAGGTCTSGAASGTVVFTPANAHTGAWTIQSATAGIQESLNATKVAVIPPGSYHVYATITPPLGSVIEGAGSGAYYPAATTLTFHSANTKFLNLVNDNFVVRDIALVQDAGVVAVAGNAGIYTAGSGSGVAAATGDWGTIENVSAQRFYNGLYAAGDGGSVDLNHVFVEESVSDGAVALSAQGYWNALIVQASGGHGVVNGHAVPGGGVPPFFTGLQTYGNEGWGVYATNAFQITANSFLNNDRLGELYVEGALGEMGYFTDSYVQWSGVPYAGAPWVTNPTAPGILLEASAGPVTISNIHFYGCQGNGIKVESGNHRISDNRIIASGQGLQAGHVYSIRVEGASALDETITGNDLRQPVRVATSGTTFAHNWIQGSSAEPMFYLVSGTNNIFDGNHFFQAGAGPAYQIDTGATLQNGQNTVQAGAIVNNGTLSADTKQLFNYSAKAYSTANPAIAALATGVWTAVPFDTNVTGFNTVMHDGAVNNTRFTAPAAGTYLLIGEAVIQASAGGTMRQARWIKNGAVSLGNIYATFGAAAASQPHLVVAAYMAAGDYVEYQVYQDSGGALTVAGGSEPVSYASVQRIN